MECVICYEKYDSDDRLPINCIQCKEKLCTHCFMEIVTTCNNACHIKYNCPICRQEINITKEFLDKIFRMMTKTDYLEFKNKDKEVVLKASKDKTTGEIEWKKRNIVWSPFIIIQY